MDDMQDVLSAADKQITAAVRLLIHAAGFDAGQQVALSIMADAFAYERQRQASCLSHQSH
jgi:hypothetical protein